MLCGQEPLFDRHGKHHCSSVLPKVIELVESVEKALRNVKEIHQEGPWWTLVSDNKNAGVSTNPGSKINIPPGRVPNSPHSSGAPVCEPSILTITKEGCCPSSEAVEGYL